MFFSNKLKVTAIHFGIKEDRGKSHSEFLMEVERRNVAK